MKSKIRREITWLCLPLVLIIGAGAWISRAQSEGNARQRQRESGLLRARVWGIINMGVWNNDKAAGYDYGYRITAHIEGQDVGALKPGEVWMARVKSARIVAGKIAKQAKVVHVMAPLVYQGKMTVPFADVMAITDVDPKPREVLLWLYCDSPLNNPDLQLQIEVVAGKIAPVVGSRLKKKFVVSGAHIIAPTETIPLRPWNQNNDKANSIKSTY